MGFRLDFRSMTFRIAISRPHMAARARLTYAAIAGVLVVPASWANVPDAASIGRLLEHGGPAATVQVAPRPDARWSEEAIRLYRAGDWKSLASYARRWFEAQPDSAQAGTLLGLAQLKLDEIAASRATLSAVVARHPRDETAHVYLGWAHLAERNAAEAERSARRALDLAGNNPEAWTVLASAQVLLERYADAEASVDAGIRIAPGYTALWVMRAHVLEAQKRYPAALEAIEHAAGLEPLDPQSRGTHALLLARAGRLQQARALLASSPNAGSATAAAWNQIGVEEVRAGRARDAEADYRRATQADPGWVIAWLNLAALLQQAGRLTESEATLRQALVAQPGNATALSALAQLLTLIGPRSEAAAVVVQAEKAGPSSVHDVRALGAAYFNLGNWRAAAERYEQATKLDGTQAADWVYLGNARYQLRRPEEALRAYEQAERLDRNDLGLLNALARFYGEKGDFARALGYSERGTEREPNNTLLWNAKGFSLLKLGRNQEAIAALTRATKLQPEYPSPWTNLGMAYLQARDFGKAIDALKRALELAPMAGDVLLFLARALAGNGELRASLAQVERLLERSPNHVPAWYMLGLLAIVMDNSEDLKMAYEELRDLAPPAADALMRQANARAQGATVDLLQ